MRGYAAAAEWAAAVGGVNALSHLLSSGTALSLDGYASRSAGDKAGSVLGRESANHALLWESSNGRFSTARCTPGSLNLRTSCAYDIHPYLVDECYFLNRSHDP